MRGMIKPTLAAAVTASAIFYAILAPTLGWNPVGWQEQIEVGREMARETYLNQCAAALQEIDNG